MKYQTILFDLDGTLTDSQEGITRCVQYALAHFGIEVEDLSTLRKFIGPPLTESFKAFYGMDEHDAHVGLMKYRERFLDVGWAENAVYPGVEALVQKLRGAGKRLLLATSKPEAQARRIMEHFGLAPYFEHICGPGPNDPDHYGKAEVIRDALARAGITGAAGVIMVGDRRHDVEGAHKMGLPCIGVLYGYGSREELEKSGAEFVAEDMAALEKHLMA